MTVNLELVSEHRCHGGWQRYYQHDSKAIGLPMRFSVFLPEQAQATTAKDDSAQPMGTTKRPVLIYLAGLTCTEDTFTTKAAAQQYAAQQGLILVTPDTSPRGAGAAGEDDHWDFGTGAGFYLDATTPEFAKHYRMESYVADELFNIVTTVLPGDAQRVGVFGHSMGGHGALVLALRHQDKFKSVSAFAPISAPTQCPWGEKAFMGYLGEDRTAWQQHDASSLMASQNAVPFPQGILIDQGLGDQFLERELHPHLFEAACAQVGQPLTLRRHDDYDHGYFFIMSFMKDHIEHHVKQLGV